MTFKTGIGQDSHRFEAENSKKKCIIGGLVFDNVPGFLANSDGDIVYHAITNAISSISGILILGAIADELCLNQGITDSEIYLKEALKTLGDQKITHIAITIEANRPKLKHRIDEMRQHIANVIGIDKSQVGITATTGEGLTAFGRGEGAQCFAIVSTQAQ